jgi:excinuclease ABC subunit C
VYRFRDARGRVLYLGRAANLRRRVGSYWTSLGDRRHLARMVRRIGRIEVVSCDSEHEAAWLERNALERAMPYWNRTPGGQEVPVCVRLDRRGLAVVHTATPRPGVRYFGPYLGGLRVRTAVSGLNRLLPLAYANDRLRGSERDLARVRGIEAADRGAYERMVVGALEREPEAVAGLRAEFVRRRDAFAATLAYELAGRVQAEIEALDWVVAEQKVTRLEPEDLDVHGWSGSVLVTFEIRGGRLDGWTQRPSTEAAALSKVAGTPPGWSGFAQRNAALAARLSVGPALG